VRKSRAWEGKLYRAQEKLEATRRVVGRSRTGDFYGERGENKGKSRKTRHVLRSTREEGVSHLGNRRKGEGGRGETSILSAFLKRITKGKRGKSGWLAFEKQGKLRYFRRSFLPFPTL